MEKRVIYSILIIFIIIASLFTVFAAPNFDLNGDGSVTVSDISSLAQLYRGKGTYNASYDFNNDTDIDLFDLVYLARNVGVSDGGDLHPNEPAGLSQIYWNDGTEADLRNDGWSLDCSGPDAATWLEHITSIADSENPTGWNVDNPVGSGYVLNLYHPDGFPATAGTACGEWGNILGSPMLFADEVYISLQVFLTNGTPDDNFQHGKKFFYLKMENGGSDLYLTFETNGVMRITQQGVGDNGWDYAVQGAFNEADRANQWVQVEFWVKAESAVNAGDAEVKLWVDGTLYDYTTDLYTSSPDGSVGPRIEGIVWYNVETGSGDHYAHNHQIGELYISGKSGD